MSRTRGKHQHCARQGRDARPDCGGDESVPDEVVPGRALARPAALGATPLLTTASLPTTAGWPAGLSGSLGQEPQRRCRDRQGRPQRQPGNTAGPAALRARTTLPSTTTLPGTTTLPSTTTLPGTTTLPSTTTLPGTTTLASTTTLPSTTTLAIRATAS